MKATIYKTVEGFTAFTDGVDGKVGSGINKAEALMDLALQFDDSGEKEFEVDDLNPTYFMSREEIEDAGIDYDELVAYVANEHHGGAIQAYFTEEQLEAGAHYAEAKDMLTEATASDLVAEYTAWKATKT